MTQNGKVKVNQWLITVAVGVVGIWGGYQVLQYKVAVNSTYIDEIETEGEIEKVKVWGRFERDRVERQDNKDNIGEIKYDIKAIRKDQVLIQDDVKEILEKME